eukprot:TRINITY_DN7935_c0_g1_i1.p1 TRINITY_DN7935_c0_g1~~TRINITY_DN7935_c0_g1_i1.p1  ORF type:complete len:785 (-),score=104.93 TRINITY_DN7935_c0_g1_i1:14-2368(-)
MGPFGMWACLVVYLVHVCAGYNPVEHLFLQNFYDSTGGSAWKNSTNWKSGTDYCTWYGISCLDTITPSVAVVTSLILDDNNVQGTLPLSISSLTSLQTLSFSSNNITGSLPSVLFGMANLTYLALDNNPSLVADISTSFFSGFTFNLDHLDLSGIRFSGTLPPQFCNVGLRYLNISRSSSSPGLSGTIPNMCTAFNPLQQIDLSYNMLSGTLPSSLLSLFFLVSVDLHHNMLAGALPSSASWGGTRLAHVDLSYNQLSGSLPNIVFGAWNANSLQWMDLSFNNLTGPFPSICVDMPAISYFNISNNLVRGEVPSSLTRFTGSNITVDMSNCSLEGGIPQDLSSIDFQHLIMSFNYLSGTLPPFLQDEPSNVNPQGTVDLQCNMFCTPLPTWCAHPDDSGASVLGNCTLCTSGIITACPTNPGLSTEMITMIITFSILGCMSLTIGGLLLWVYKLRRRKLVYFQLADRDNVFLTDVIIGPLIGSGVQGQVFKGTWQGVDVALKTMSMTGDQVAHIQEEARIMMSLNHPNVVTFLGLYKDESDKDRLYLVTEYMPLGSLDKLLAKPYAGMHYTTQHRIQMCRDVAAGMMQLEAKKIAHCDLAARNLLVSSNYTVRVTDFGLSRSQDNLRESESRIPVRWSAPEVIQSRLVSSQSDVWSFAVTMWEIIHLGALPYQGMSNQECFQWVLANPKNRLKFPPSVPPDVVELASACWDLVPSRRPSFKTILERLDVIINRSYHDSIEQAIKNDAPDSTEAIKQQREEVLNERMPLLMSDRYDITIYTDKEQ